MLWLSRLDALLLIEPFPSGLFGELCEALSLLLLLHRFLVYFKRPLVVVEHLLNGFLERLGYVIEVEAAEGYSMFAWLLPILDRKLIILKGHIVVFLLCENYLEQAELHLNSSRRLKWIVRSAAPG